MIPRSGRSPGGGHAAHSSVLAWRVPWTETGYSLWDRKELDATEVTEHAHTALLETFFFLFFSIMVYHRILTIVYCAIQ